jgi:hypothetical protein
MAQVDMKQTDCQRKSIFCGQANWKSQKNHVGEKYFIMIRRNYMDSQFCPVFWLMYMLALKKKHGDPMTGPLFPIRKLEIFKSILRLCSRLQICQNVPLIL